MQKGLDNNAYSIFGHFTVVLCVEGREIVAKRLRGVQEEEIQDKE